MSVVIPWPHKKLESASNGRGHTRFRSRAVDALRSHARLLVSSKVRHWLEPDPAKAAKAAERARQRLAGVKVARYLLEPVSLTKPLVVTLVRIAPRSLDDDNLRGAFKPMRDGVADALGSDDRTPMIEWRYAQRRGAPKEYAVEITIEERGS